MPLPALTLAARALNGTTPISCSTGAQHAEAMPEEGWWYEPSNVLPSGEHVVLKWAQEATYVWLQSTGEVEAWLHADDSCMTTTQRGRFVQHFIPGEEDPRLYAGGQAWVHGFCMACGGIVFMLIRWSGVQCWLCPGRSCRPITRGAATGGWRRMAARES